MEVRLPHVFNKFLSDEDFHHVAQVKDEKTIMGWVKGGFKTLSYLDGTLLHRSDYGSTGNFLLYLRFKLIMRLHRLKRRILRLKERLMERSRANQGENN